MVAFPIMALNTGRKIMATGKRWTTTAAVYPIILPHPQIGRRPRLKMLMSSLFRFFINAYFLMTIFSKVNYL